jgi:hypothetical protein
MRLSARSTLLMFVILAFFASVGQAQTYAINTRSNLCDGRGHLLAPEKVCSCPCDVTGSPLGVCGAGQVFTRSVCMAVESGVITPASGTFQVLNTATTNPAPYCRNAALQKDSRMLPSTVYSCMQMPTSWCSSASGTYTCNSDNFPPISVAQEAPTLTAGRPPTGTAGSSAPCKVDLNGAASSHSMNCAIPQGPTGRTGPIGPNIARLASDLTNGIAATENVVSANKSTTGLDTAARGPNLVSSPLQDVIADNTTSSITLQEFVCGGTVGGVQERQTCTAPTNWTGAATGGGTGTIAGNNLVPAPRESSVDNGPDINYW